MINPKSMDKLLVSVIVPAFNCATTIQECLKSLFNSQIPESLFEVIVINDGSTDNTLSLLDNLKEEHENLIVISQNNQGVSAARNNGIKNAKGKWICFVDSDDTVNPSFLELPSKAAGNCDLIICAYDFFEDGTFVRRQEILDKSYNSIDQFVTQQKSLFFDSCGPWAKFYLRDILVSEDIQFNTNLRIAEDRLFFYDYLYNIRISQVFSLIGYNYYSTSNGLRFKPVPKDMQRKRLELISNSIKRIKLEKGLTESAWIVLKKTYYAQVNAASYSWSEDSLITMLKDICLITNENGIKLPYQVYFRIATKHFVRKFSNMFKFSK